MFFRRMRKAVKNDTNTRKRTKMNLGQVMRRRRRRRSRRARNPETWMISRPSFQEARTREETTRNCRTVEVSC